MNVFLFETDITELSLIWETLLLFLNWSFNFLIYSSYLSISSFLSVSQKLVNFWDRECCKLFGSSFYPIANWSFELNSFSLLFKFTVVVEDFFSWRSSYFCETMFYPVIFSYILLSYSLRYWFYLYNCSKNILSWPSVFPFTGEFVTLLFPNFESPINFSLSN